MIARCGSRSGVRRCRAAPGSRCRLPYYRKTRPPRRARRPAADRSTTEPKVGIRISPGRAPRKSCALGSFPLLRANLHPHSVAGLSRRETGAELYISLNTVKTHARELYRKLGATPRADAIARRGVRPARDDRITRVVLRQTAPSWLPSLIGSMSSHPDRLVVEGELGPRYPPSRTRSTTGSTRPHAFRADLR